jgi:ABC-type multidrug transport system fused ATPase/permease subunit
MPVLRVLNYLKSYPRLAILQLACAVFGTLLVIVVPNQTRIIIDDIIRPGNADLLVPAVLIGLAAYFGQHLLNSLRIILNNTFEQKVIFDLRSDLYAKLQRLPLRWFDNQRSGDLMTRVAEDVPAMERVLIDGIEQGVVASLQILIVATVMFYVNPALTWIVLIPMPFLAFGAYLYTTTAKDR